MSNLGDHARRELELIGEDEKTIEWYVSVIEKFAEFCHSGYTAAITTDVLYKLLQFQNLSPITNNPNEWMHIDENIGGPNLWQSRRNPEIFSTDGGKTYYVVNYKQVKYESMEYVHD